MMSAEVRVNGRMIGHLYVRNLMQVNGAGLTRYEVEYYQVGEGALVRTEVWHDAELGAERLVSIALEKVRHEPEYKPFKGVG